MRLSLRLSPSLQTSIAGKLEVELDGDSIESCINSGVADFPEIKDILFQDEQLNPQILLFHNNTMIKHKDFSSPVHEGDVLDVIPAIEAG